MQGAELLHGLAAAEAAGDAEVENDEIEGGIFREFLAVTADGFRSVAGGFDKIPAAGEIGIKQLADERLVLEHEDAGGRTRRSRWRGGDGADHGIGQRGQMDGEHGEAGLRAHVDPAAMRLGDALAHGQPEAGGVLVGAGGEVRLEQTRQVLRRDAFAIVDDLQRGQRLRRAAREDAEKKVARTSRWHGLLGVAEQIFHEAAELRGIPLRFTQVRAFGETIGDILHASVLGEDIAHQRPDGEPPPHGRAAAGEGEEILHQPLGLARGLGRGLQLRARFRRGGSARGQREIAGQDREQVVEIMREAARQQAERLQPVQPRRFLLGRLFVADVAQQHEQPFVQRVNARLPPTRRAIIAQLERAALALEQRRAEILVVRAMDRGWEFVPEHPPDERLAFGREGARRRGVHIREAPLRIETKERIADALEDRVRRLRREGHPAGLARGLAVVIARPKENHQPGQPALRVTNGRGIVDNRHQPPPAVGQQHRAPTAAASEPDELRRFARRVGNPEHARQRLTERLTGRPAGQPLGHRIEKRDAPAEIRRHHAFRQTAQRAEQPFVHIGGRRRIPGAPQRRTGGFVRWISRWHCPFFSGGAARGKRKSNPSTTEPSEGWGRNTTLC